MISIEKIIILIMFIVIVILSVVVVTSGCNCSSDCYRGSCGNYTVTSDDINAITGSYFLYGLNGNSMYQFSVYAKSQATPITYDKNNDCFIDGDHKWYLLNKVNAVNTTIYELFSTTDISDPNNLMCLITVDAHGLTRQLFFKTSTNNFYTSVKNLIHNFTVNPGKTSDTYNITFTDGTTVKEFDANTPDTGCNNDIIVSSIFYSKTK